MRVLTREIIANLAKVVKPNLPILDSSVPVMYTAIVGRGRNVIFRLKE
jgi:hypothetical protein